jgi:cardiolipin synthase
VAAVVAALSILVSGCAVPSADPLGAAASVIELPAPGTTPDRAVARAGRLLLRYPAAAGGVLLSADWDADASAEPGPAYHAAVLAPSAAEASLDSEVAAGASVVRLLPQATWEATLRELLATLAPEAPLEAAMIGVHGRDVVIWRSTDGAVHTAWHERKPPEVRVRRSHGEPAFAALARRQLAEQYGADARLLFDTGDGAGTFGFFDLPAGVSVLVLRETAPSAVRAGEAVGYALRVSDALVLRSHVLGPLLRPVTAAGRLAWLTSQSAMTLLPRPPGPSDETNPPLAARPPMDPSAWEAGLDGMQIGTRTRGTIEPLIDGEAFFGALVQAIQDARESIDIRLYIFDRDDFALRVAELLKRRSHEVRVRIVLDYLGTLSAAQASGPRVYPYAGAEAHGEASILDILRRDSRIEVRASANPWLTGDHTKVVVIDRQRAFAGGMNIGYEYRYVWHDMMVALQGPVVTRLADDFDRRWAHAGPGGDLAFAAASAAALAGPRDRQPDEPSSVDLRLLYTRAGDPQILRAQVAAAQRATARIWIQQPYVADDTMIGELVGARRRGVDVRVILPSEGDSGFMNSANLVAANAFVRHGVRVYVYPGMTHVKAALYDGWALVGSANLDKLSLRVNLETNVGTTDPRFVARLERELFEPDFARSRPMDRPRSIGWPTYLGAFLARQL